MFMNDDLMIYQWNIGCCASYLELKLCYVKELNISCQHSASLRKQNASFILLFIYHEHVAHQDKGVRERLRAGPAVSSPKRQNTKQLNVVKSPQTREHEQAPCSVSTAAYQLPHMFCCEAVWPGLSRSQLKVC